MSSTSRSIRSSTRSSIANGTDSSRAQGSDSNTEQAARRVARGVSQRVSMGERLVEQMSAPINESVLVLKRTVAASVALARLDKAVQLSTVGQQFASVLLKLDVAGGLLLDGQSVDIESLLLAQVARQPTHVRRAMAQRTSAIALLAQMGIDQAFMTRVANAYTAASATEGVRGRNAIRSRALSGKARQGIAPEQRLVNDAQCLEDGLRAWLHFIDRGAGDAESVLMSGSACRRWMQLRPYSRANTCIGMSVMDALSRVEGVSKNVTLPLAWHFASHGEGYRHALASIDESHWHLWWLASVTAVAEACLKLLQGWEAELNRLRGDPTVDALGPDALAVLIQPAFDGTDLVRAARVSRKRIKLFIDARVETNDLLAVASGRSGRYANARLWRLTNEWVSA